MANQHLGLILACIFCPVSLLLLGRLLYSCYRSIERRPADIEEAKAKKAAVRATLPKIVVTPPPPLPPLDKPQDFNFLTVHDAHFARPFFTTPTATVRPEVMRPEVPRPDNVAFTYQERPPVPGEDPVFREPPPPPEPVYIGLGYYQPYPSLKELGQKTEKFWFKKR